MLADAVSPMEPVVADGSQANVPQYTVAAADKEMVNTASSPNAVPKGVRNKLYGAIRRNMIAAEAGALSVPAAVIARYKEAVERKGNGNQAMWTLLKEFVQDPTCASMKFEERHVVAAVKWQTTEFVWLTRIEAIIMFQGHVWEPGLKYAEKLLETSKQTKRHPQRPNDDDFKMYKILKATVEGSMKSMTSTQTATVSGNITSKESAGVILDKFQKEEKKLGAVAVDADTATPTKLEKTDAQKDAERKRKEDEKKG